MSPHPRPNLDPITPAELDSLGAIVDLLSSLFPWEIYRGYPHKWQFVASKRLKMVCPGVVSKFVNLCVAWFPSVHLMHLSSPQHLLHYTNN